MGARHLTSIDLSSCLRQTTIPLGAFFECDKLSSIVFPSTLQSINGYVFSGWKDDGATRESLPCLKTLVWMGRSTRSAILHERTFYPESFEDLITSGKIQEIFVP